MRGGCGRSNGPHKPLVAELQLRGELGVAGAEICQLLLQRVVGFI